MVRPEEFGYKGKQTKLTVRGLPYGSKVGGKAKDSFEVADGENGLASLYGAGDGRELHAQDLTGISKTHGGIVKVVNSGKDDGVDIIVPRNGEVTVPVVDVHGSITQVTVKHS